MVKNSMDLLPRKGIEHSRNLMTVRIVEILGLENILKLSSSLGIYDEIPELLSVSLGSAETTLMNLTAGYARFRMEEIANPILINKIQDRRGNTIFNLKSVNAKGVKNIPQLRLPFNEIFRRQSDITRNCLSNDFNITRCNKKRAGKS